MPPQENWHLDKKIPIGLFFGILTLFFGLIGQTVFITSWLTAKLEGYDHRLVSLEKTDTNQSSHENRIIILEQQFGYIRGDLAEIKTLLRRTVPDPTQQP